MTRYQIVLPYSKPPLSANQRMHWAVKSNATREVRLATRLLARAAGIPRMQTITVRVEYFPRDRRRRDPSNLMPTQKAVVDGLVDAGIVPDDCPPYVTEWMPTITTQKEPLGASGSRLRVTIISGRSTTAEGGQ